MKQIVFLLLLCIAGTGCNTVVQNGLRGHEATGARVLMPPFFNATDDEHAGRAMHEIAASVLLERGVRLVQSEPLLVATRKPTAAGDEGMYVEAARAANATHLLIGTVHEYRYKTDLDGDPAVGVSVRLVDPATGETIWQGTSGRVGVLFASLTTASQRAMRDVLAKLPWNMGGEGGAAHPAPGESPRAGWERSFKRNP